MFRHLLMTALSVAVGLAPVAQSVAQSIMLPNIGDPAAVYVGSDEEQRLGLEIMRKLRDRDLVLEDPQLNAYLNSIGQSLAAYADQNGVPFNFFMVRSAAINAFALPHNFIGINAGLLLATEREDELAGVVAHEIAHVSQRHIVRAIADMRRMALPMAAAMIASAALAAASKQGGQAALVSTMAASAQHQISFTRANEQEADRIGIRFLAKAGFDPRGMSDFFAKLERRSGGLENQIPEMLLTHPRPETRLADTQDRLEVPKAASRTGNRDRKAYELAKARARVLATDDVQTLIREFETTLSQGSNNQELANRYAYALALRQAGRYDQARQQIIRLLQSDPDRLAFRIEAAELALAKGEHEQGWRLFEELRQLYPDDFALAMHYGRALATQGDAKQALRVLRPYLTRHTNDPNLYQSYAQAAERAGDMAATHATMAEYYYLNGELLPAIEQLEVGLRTASLSPNEEARLRSRLKQFRAEAIAQDLPVPKQTAP